MTSEPSMPVRPRHVARPEATLLRVILGLMFLASAFGLFVGLNQRSELTAACPRLIPLWPLYLSCPVISLVALAGMWCWKRWGVWLATATGIVAMAIEFYACGPAPHVFRVPVALAILVAAVRSNWQHFLGRPFPLAQAKLAHRPAGAATIRFGVDLDPHIKERSDMSDAASSPWLPVVELLVVFAGYAAMLRAPGGMVYGTPLLVLVSLLLLWRAGLRLDAVGLARSRLTSGTVLRGVGLACALAVVAWSALRPLCESITHATLETTKLREAVAEPAGLALMLVMSWTFAGFGEEWVFRGYPLTRLAALGPRTQWVGLLASSVLFGWAHDYQGPAGRLLAGTVGFTLGVVYLRSGRNLWLNIITHGVTDTIAMLLFHFRLL